MQIGVETSKAVDQRRVFVIDEDEITRAALQFMLHDEIETHELANPEEAYAKGIGWLQPHVVLLGVSFLRQRGGAVAFDTSGENRNIGCFRNQIITLVRMARRLLLRGWNKE